MDSIACEEVSSPAAADFAAASENGKAEFNYAEAEEEPRHDFHDHHFHEHGSNSHSHSHVHSDAYHKDQVPHPEEMVYSDSDLEEERQHFRTVKAAFRYYRKHCFKKIGRQKTHYLALSSTHRNKLPSLPAHLDALRQCTDVNYQFILRILEQIPFDEPNEPTMEVAAQSPADQTESMPPVGSFQMDKVHTTIRMFVRDWSAEGALERHQSYDPLLNAVRKYVPLRDKEGDRAKILNPGSGLGRLPWELARMGYTSFGNEFSLYMLFASNFVLNCCSEADMYKIYPWIGQASNNMSSADKLAGISVPDVSPTDLSPDHCFGMVAGDFLEVFHRDGTWSAVVTCFFIDTARNILEYIEHIYGLLRPGAFWFNLGPLLYHFADRAQEGCTELTYEELKEAIIRSGFVFLEERCDIPCLYVQNARSMLRSEYRCIFFACQKPLEENTQVSNHETEVKYRLSTEH
ncbi:Carnosine N-methyltransferase [Hypsibius exemplaris]|uniref:carnosine N-methyltransferase n=1 Tax=Hypsibius exemplaris TaxID=2072580 RepID=A0A1W0WRW1_HYPEX|nr:Carnosine N-methyltransferase [Hypsibius exemplaris]